MEDDPIIDEVRKAREAYAAQFDYDLTAMCDDLRRRTEEAAQNGKVVVTLAPRRAAVATVPSKKAAG